MSQGGQHSPVGLGLVLLAAIALTVATASNAVDALGSPFPSQMVDPDGIVSYLRPWYWEVPHNPGGEPIERPCRLVGLEGAPLPTDSRFTREYLQRLEALKARSTVSLRFECPGQPGFELPRVPMRTLQAGEVLLLYGVYALAAWMLLWSGTVLFLLCGRRLAGRTYLFWSIASFTLLTTLFDYHTTFGLKQVFSASTVALPLSGLWLAYGFPQPPDRGRKVFLGGMWVITLAALLAVAWLELASARGWHPGPVRQGVDLLLVVGILAPPVTALVRLKRSSGRDRAELMAASWGLIVTPGVIALNLVLTLVTRRDYLHLVLPFFVLGIPLSVGHALIRNNILASGSILTSRMLVVPMAFCALILALMGGYSMYQVLETWPGAHLVTAVLSGSAFFVGLLLWGRRMSVRSFFPAALHFRPTIERLSDQLASLQHAFEVRQAVEGLVTRWLPTPTARVLDPKELPSLEHLPPDFQEELGQGRHVWTRESPWQRHLLVPMRSLGALRGVLLVAPKRGGALYTEDDLALLDTMASLGAVALHHTEVLQEVEHLRRLEIEAARDEKRLALGLLSAEISHEIAYPLNFIRYLLKQAGRGVPLSSKDVETGNEEVERLRRMLVALRKLRLPVPRPEPTDVLPPLLRAVELIRESLKDRHTRLVLDVPGGLRVLAEADSLVQVFANLLRNAAEAAGEQGQVGVSSSRGAQGLVLEVWDSGEGVPEPQLAQLFSYWVTSKEGGNGIGLAVTHRIIRGFDWDISYHREAGRTCFRITVPRGQVVTPEPEVQEAI